MTFSQQKKLLLCISLLVTQAVQSVAFRQAIKNMRPLHYFIAGSPMLTGAYALIGEKQLERDIENLSDVDVLMMAKCKKMADKAGVGVQDLIIKVDSGHSGMCMFSNSLAHAIVVDPTFLNDGNYSQQEKMAVFGHELMHIKNKDGHFRVASFFVLPIFSHITLEKAHFVLAKKFSKTPRGLVAGCLTKLFLMQYAFNKFSQYQEKRADIDSVITFDNAQDLASWAKKFKQENGDNPLDFVHPKWDTRIEYLKKIAKEQEAKKA